MGKDVQFLRLSEAFNYLKRKKGITQQKLAELMGTTQTTVSRNLKAAAEGSIYDGFVVRMNESVGDIFNVDYILNGNGTLLKEKPNTNIIIEKKGVPYYNVDFELGFDIMENDQTRHWDDMIDFPQYNKCTCWVNAHGDSMTPTIASGDMVALKKLDDFRYLISGEIYAIVTKNGLRTIKRINDKGESIQLIPDNKDYEEQFIPKEELLHVFVVKGCMKAY